MQDAAVHSHDEKELILKALSYYQVHLFDEISKKSNESDVIEYKKTTSVIKKMHSSIEKHS